MMVDALVEAEPGAAHSSIHGCLPGDCHCLGEISVDLGGFPVTGVKTGVETEG